MKCKYCPYEGYIFHLRQHIMNKKICKNKYTEDDLLEFENIYVPYKQEHRKNVRASSHQRKKRRKETKVIIFTYLVTVTVLFLKVK